MPLTPINSDQKWTWVVPEDGLVEIRAVGLPGPAGPAGPGVPTGGFAGNILRKASGTDFDTVWFNLLGTLNAWSASQRFENGVIVADAGSIDFALLTYSSVADRLVSDTNLQAPFFIGNGSLLTNLPVQPVRSGNTLFVDSDPGIGNDGTALPDRFDKPYLTLTAAQTAAASGDTAKARTGAYTVAASIAKAGVNWHFEPGTLVTYTLAGSPTLIDDGNTAMTFVVDGAGDLHASGSGAATNTHGLRVRHASSDVTVRCKSLKATVTGAATPAEAFAAAVEGGKVNLTAEAITAVIGGSDLEGEALMWTGGEFNVTAHRIEATGDPGWNGWGIWCAGGSVPTGEFRVRAHEISGCRFGVSSQGSNSASWMRVDAHTIRTTSTTDGLGASVSYGQANNSTIEAQYLYGAVRMGFASGKHFLKAHRLTAVSNGSADSYGGLIFNEAGSASGRFVIELDEADPNGMTGEMFLFQNGTWEIRGMRYVANASSDGIKVANLANVRLVDCYIDTSANALTNPITKSGGTLTLVNCTLVANAGRNVIEAATAQSVAIEGTLTANRPNHANVTTSGGPLVRSDTGAVTTFGTVTAGDTLTVRQPGGVAGTDQVEIYHDGTAGYIRNRDGGASAGIRFRNTADTANNMVVDDNGNITFRNGTGLYWLNSGGSAVQLVGGLDAADNAKFVNQSTGHLDVGAWNSYTALVYNGSGHHVGYWDANGFIFNQAGNLATTTIPVRIKATSGHTANMLEVQSNTGVLRAGFNSDGSTVIFGGGSGLFDLGSGLVGVAAFPWVGAYRDFRANSYSTSAQVFLIYNTEQLLSHTFPINWNDGASTVSGTRRVGIKNDQTNFPNTLLVTDGSSGVGNVKFGREVHTPFTAAQITADQNNYSPATVTKLTRFTTDAARTMTGLVAGFDGEERVFFNVGSNNLVLAHESSSSTAANRFTVPGGSSVLLVPGSSARLTYDGTASRWLVDTSVAAAQAAPAGEVVKAADQVVTNNATPQDDTELQVAVATNSTYLVEFEIVYSGNSATGDFRWRFSHPTLALARQSNGWYSGFNNSDVSTAVNAIGSTTQWPTTDAVAGTDAANTISVVKGFYVLRTDSTSGTLKLQFANGTAGGGVTSTCRAGSRVRWKKLS